MEWEVTLLFTLIWCPPYLPLCIIITPSQHSLNIVIDMFILLEVSKMKHLGSLDCDPGLENLILIGSNNVHISKYEPFQIQTQMVYP